MCEFADWFFFLFPKSWKEFGRLLLIILAFILAYYGFAFGRGVWDKHFGPETLAPLAPGATFAPTVPPTIAPSLPPDTRDFRTIVECGIHADQSNIVYLLFGVIVTYTILFTFLLVMVIRYCEIDREMSTVKMFTNSLFLSIFFGLVVGLGLLGRFYYIGKNTNCQ